MSSINVQKWRCCGQGWIDISDGADVGMSKLGDIHYQTINFNNRDLINDDCSFCSLIPSAMDLQCHVFPFEKLFLYVRLFM